MPAMTAPLVPPSCPPAAAADASDGCERAADTPVHRSPVALRVEAAGAVVGALLCVLLAVAVERDLFGAVELAKTDCPACWLTPAVEPLTRERTALWGAGCVAVERAGRAAGCGLTAPLVVARAVAGA